MKELALDDILNVNNLMELEYPSEEKMKDFLHRGDNNSSMQKARGWISSLESTSNNYHHHNSSMSMMANNSAL